MTSAMKLAPAVPTASHAGLRDWAFTDDGSPTGDLLEAGRLLTGRTLDDLELVRHGVNLVAKSEAAGMVLRVRGAEFRDAKYSNLLQAKRLATEGAKVVAPATTAVAVVGDYAVTAWPLGVAGVGKDFRGWGAAVRSVHESAIPSGLPRLTVADRFEARLGSLPEGVPSDVKAELWRRAAEAEDLFEELREGPQVLLHGDAHEGNCVRVGGQVRLIDLDGLSVGPREYDLLPGYVAFTRFHKDEKSWRKFMKGYGADVDWDRLARFAGIRESTMNSWLATMWDVRPETRPELLHRMETWGTQGHRPWSAA